MPGLPFPAPTLLTSLILTACRKPCGIFSPVTSFNLNVNAYQFSRQNHTHGAPLAIIQPTKHPLEMVHFYVVCVAHSDGKFTYTQSEI
jgi:hypothetical protein